MSQKKKDLAQELVDFLMKEDDVVNLRGPKLVTPPSPTSSTAQTKSQNEEQKTVALEEPAFEFSVNGVDNPLNLSIEEKNEDPQKNTIKLVDFDNQSKTAHTVHHSTAKTESPIEPVKSTSVPDFKAASTGMGPNLSSQRANIVFNDVSSLLAGTEAVKVAQARIKTLEKEKEQIRTEMEQLLTGSESLQRRLNELRTQHENLERKHKEKIEILEDEKSVLKTRLNAKDEELGRVKKENEDLRARFQNDIRKIRVRERELEGRQEIMRAEMVSALSGKDEVIMELRRQLEKLSFEIDTFKTKSVDTNNKLTEFYDRNHRTVKALRLALSILEVGDADDKTKKVG